MLDFANDASTIKSAFEDYYRTTLLSEETDPIKLYGLKDFARRVLISLHKCSTDEVIFEKVRS